MPKLEGATDVGTRFEKSLRDLQRGLIVIGREVLAAGDAKAIAEVDAIHVRSPDQIALYFCNNPGSQQSRGGSMQCIMKLEWPERRPQSSMYGSLDRATLGLEAWQHCSPKEKLDRIVNWFTLPPMHKTKTASSLTRQAAYQRRRRARQRPATFFPADRDRLDRAVRESGLGLQGWLERAVEERIEHQARLARLVSEAFRRFRAKCFWNVSADQPLSLLAPLVVKRLKKYGGMAGLRLATEIEARAPEETRWP